MHRLSLPHSRIGMLVRPQKLAATISLAVLISHSAIAEAESLADAIGAAYESNPTLRQTRFRLKSTNETYVQQRAAFGPTLSIRGTGQFTNTRAKEFVDIDPVTDEPISGFVSNNSNAAQANLILSQTIYSGGQLRGAMAQARANVLSGQQALRATEIQLIQTVIQAYAAVLRDQSRVKVGEENLKVLLDQLDEKRSRLRQQDVTVTDVAQSESRLAAAETQLATLQASLDIVRSQYVQVVGHSPGTLEPLPDLPGMPESSDEAYARAEENNPTLLSTKYTEAGTSAAVTTARGQGKPVVSVSAQAGYTGQLTPFDSSNYQRNITGTVTVTQPIFSSGAVRSRIRQAKANDDAQQAAIDAARRDALQSVTQAWAQLYSARKGLTAGARQVEFAQIAFSGMRHEERAGYRDAIETLNAEQELTSAQLSFLANRYNEYVARAALLAAMGELSVASLAPGTALYDPEADFRKVRNRGRSPIEPLVEALDTIGAAKLRRPYSADLTGADILPSATMAPLVDKPNAALARAPLTPITQSPVVRTTDLPPGYHQDPTRIAPAPESGP